VDYWLRPKGKDKGRAFLEPTRRHPRETRRRVRSCPSHQTKLRNGITPARSQTSAIGGRCSGLGRHCNPSLKTVPRRDLSRCQPETIRGRIPQEAKAAGKAGRYADVGTVRGKWSGRVTLHKLWARLWAMYRWPAKERRERADHQSGRMIHPEGCQWQWASALRSRVRSKVSRTVLEQGRGSDPLVYCNRTRPTATSLDPKATGRAAESGR